jgi:site-specific DNA recombinase
VYKLRSFVFCTPCQRRMHGKRSRHGTPYSYCQPRGREVPSGHPPALWVNEANLVEAVTRFFNTYLVGPDRIDLAIAAIPAAHDHQAAAHEATVEAARREQHRLNEAMDNLLAVLERSSDPEGQLYRRAEQRIAQFEVDYAAATARLAELERDRPQPSGVNFQLLDHLPQGQLDLADLTTDRLRRFLDAFNVKIYFDHTTTTARLTAEIASGTIPDLARLVGAIVADPPRHASIALSEDDHDAGGGRSSRWCPRQDSNLRPRLRRAVLYPLSYGGSVTRKG